MHRRGIAQGATAPPRGGSSSIRRTDTTATATASTSDKASNRPRDSFSSNFNLACTSFLRLHRRCNRCDGCAALDSMGGSPTWLQALSLSDQQALLGLLVQQSTPSLIQQLALILGPISSSRDGYYQSGSTFNYARDMAQERFAAAVTTPMASPPSSPARRRRSRYSRGDEQHVSRRSSRSSTPNSRGARNSVGNIPHLAADHASSPASRRKTSPAPHHTQRVSPPPTLSVSRRASLTSRSRTRSHVHGTEGHKSPPTLSTIMEKRHKEQKQVLEQQAYVQQQQQQSPAVRRRVQSIGSVQDQLGGYGTSAQLHHAAAVHGLRMRSMNRTFSSRRTSSSSAAQTQVDNDQLWHTDREGASPASTLTMLQPATVAHINRRLQAPGLMSKLRAATEAGQVYIDKRADHLLHWYMSASAADAARIIAWRLLLTQIGGTCLQYLAGKVTAAQDALETTSNSLSLSHSSASTEPAPAQTPDGEQSDGSEGDRTGSSTHSSITAVSSDRRLAFRSRRHAARFDILAALPRFLAQQVLSHLDDDALETASCVSRYWRRLVASVQHHKAMRRDAVEAMMSVKRMDDTDERVTLALLSYPTTAGPQALSLPSRDFFCASFACLRLPDTPREPHHLFVAVDPTGARALSGGNSKDAVVRDVASGAVIARLRGHAGAVLGGAHLIARGLYATAGTDASIRLWCAQTQRPRGVLHGHIKAVTALAWYEEQDMLMSASSDRRIILWDLDRHRPSATKHVVRAPGSINALALCADACTVALDDGTVHVYHVVHKQFVHAGHAQIPDQAASALRPPSSALVSQRRGPQSEKASTKASVVATAISLHFVCAGAEDGRAFVYSRDALRGARATTDDAEVACFPHPVAVTCMRLLFLRLMTGCADGAIRLFSLPNKQCVRIFRVLGNSCPVRAFAFENLRSLVVSTDDAMALLDFGADAAALDTVSGSETQPLWHTEDTAHVERLRAQKEENAEEAVQTPQQGGQQQEQLLCDRKVQSGHGRAQRRRQEQATLLDEAQGDGEPQTPGTGGSDATGNIEAAATQRARARVSALSSSPSTTTAASAEQHRASGSRAGGVGKRRSSSLQRGGSRTRMRSASLGCAVEKIQRFTEGPAGAQASALAVASSRQLLDSESVAVVGQRNRSRAGSFQRARVRSRSSSNTSMGSSIGGISESDASECTSQSRLSVASCGRHKPSPSPVRAQRRSRQTLEHLYRLAVSPCRRPSTSHDAGPTGEDAVSHAAMRRTVSAMETSAGMADGGGEHLPQRSESHRRRRRTNVSEPMLAPHPETTERGDGVEQSARAAPQQQALWRQRHQQHEQHDGHMRRSRQSLVLSSSTAGGTHGTHVCRRSSAAPRSYQVTDPPLAEFDHLRRASQMSPPVRRRSTFGNTFAGEWRRYYK